MSAKRLCCSLRAVHLLQQWHECGQSPALEHSFCFARPLQHYKQKLAASHKFATRSNGLQGASLMLALSEELIHPMTCTNVLIHQK